MPFEKKLFHNNDNNNNMTIIPSVIGALGTITKGLIRGLEDLEITRGSETIQTTALLRSARMLRRLEETFCHSNSCERPSANDDVKNSQGVTIITIMIMK